MSTVMALSAPKRPLAAYPMPGAATFKGSLLNCCASGVCTCLGKTCYMSVCPCLFYGALFSKAGEPWLYGCCFFGAGLGMLRTTVRRHYGIATDGCPDIGCGSDCLTASCCGTCAACQLDLTLDEMIKEGHGMANGIPKS